MRKTEESIKKLERGIKELDEKLEKVMPEWGTARTKMEEAKKLLAMAEKQGLSESILHDLREIFQAAKDDEETKHDIWKEVDTERDAKAKELENLKEPEPLELTGKLFDQRIEDIPATPDEKAILAYLQKWGWLRFNANIKWKEPFLERYKEIKGRLPDDDRNYQFRKFIQDRPYRGEKGKEQWGFQGQVYFPTPEEPLFFLIKAMCKRLGVKFHIGARQCYIDCVPFFMEMLYQGLDFNPRGASGSRGLRKRPLDGLYGLNTGDGNE